MDQIHYLREQARRCFRLARSINHPQAIAELEAMGRDFEGRAAEEEKAAGPCRNCGG